MITMRYIGPDMRLYGKTASVMIEETIRNNNIGRSHEQIVDEKKQFAEMFGPRVMAQFDNPSIREGYDWNTYPACDFIELDVVFTSKEKLRDLPHIECDRFTDSLERVVKSLEDSPKSLFHTITRLLAEWKINRCK